MIIIACGILFSISIYLLLEPNTIRRVFGLILLGSTINLILLISGGLSSIFPPFIGNKAQQMANPLPQALILTAIVISTGLMAFLVTLLKKMFEEPND